jgi:hypothetical protein
MSSVATTSHGVKVLGSTWLHNTRPFRLPSAIAACTYSRSRIESTSPRTTRAYTTHDDTPMTMMMLRRLGPRTPITAIASRMNGKASWMSASRIRKSSTRPPKYPATSPVIIPSTPEISTAARPTTSAIREPYTMRARMSRPR